MMGAKKNSRGGGGNLNLNPVNTPDIHAADIEYNSLIGQTVHHMFIN